MNGLTAVSLFAGVGGFDLALQRSGADVVAAVEINDDCRGVLARHFPHTTLFGDVTEVTGDQLRAAGFVPGRGILTGGFPCQDLSVAGRRTGLGGARSGLFWHIMRLADELRPRWLLLENVPGLLSAVCSCPGDDACTVNGRALDCGRTETFRDGDQIWTEWLPNVPHAVRGGACAGGCMPAHGGAMGTVLGALGKRGYGFAYRVLDAQFFGVPQRRERVFIAGCLGDWAGPVQVLLEPESGQGNPAAGGQARAGTPGASGDGTGDPGGQLVAHTTGAGWWQEGPGTLRAGGGGTDQGGHLVVAATLQGGGKRGHRVDAEGAAGGHLVAVPIAMRGRDAGGQIEAGEIGEPAFTLRTPGGGSSYPMVAHARTSHQQRQDGTVETLIAHPITSREAKRSPDSDATNGLIVAHALTSEGADASEDGTGRGTPLVAVPVAWRGRGMEAGEDGIANALRSGGEGHTGDQMGYVMQAPPMAFNPQTGGSAARIGYGETPTALSSSQITAVQTSAVVRRLTPRECERLQGFPDDWTRQDADGREQSDSARYRQLGNAVAVPVVEWITGRIAAIEARAADMTAEGAA